MKKTLTILLLVLAITTSLIAGTMAYYTVTLDNLVQGEVVAKEFIFVEKEGKQTLSFSDRIAPGETVEWPFTVQNHKDGLVTETDMYYRLTFVVGATVGKQAIAPLTVTVNGQAVSLDNDGTGTLISDGAFMLQSPNNQQRDDYSIMLTWPHGNNDSEYAGNDFGTTVTVNAVAQQAPFDEVVPGEPGTEIPGGDDDETGETVDAKIAIDYEIVKIWTPGNPGDNNPPEFEYKIVIKNLSDSAIENWKLSFSLTDDQYKNSIWEATLNNNEHRYHVNPLNYNQGLKPHSSVSFGGHGITGGSNIPEDLKDLTLTGTITKNGSSTTVTYGANQIKYTRLP